MNQIVKRDYLSGDSQAFETEGKYMCREAWYKDLEMLVRKKRFPLRAVWLANNQMTDIEPLIDHTYQIIIPDTNAMNRAAKRKILVHKFGLKKKNSRIKVVKSFGQMGLLPDQKIDIANLDFCNHLDLASLLDVTRVVRRMENNSILFTTFTQHSLRSLHGNRYEKYKRISGDRDEIEKRILKVLEYSSFSVDNIPGFPLTYKSGHNNSLYSFGWYLTKQ